MIELIKGALNTFRREGAVRTVEKTAEIVNGIYLTKRYELRNPHKTEFFDVAFINGCDYSVPHPIRYRVAHQVEQLNANGMTAITLEASELKLEDVTCARSFVVFRCPANDLIEQFIALAKMLNKQVYYDIDDLVIDTKYTDTIAFLDTMSEDERCGYDDCVRDMGRTLRLCGQAITSTEGMADELGHYVDDVFVNRNTASDDMLYYSDRALFMRDELPNLREEDIPSDMRQYRARMLEQRGARKARGITIGYFSGSITHNEDFELILPALLAVLEERPDTSLKVLGLLDLPSELEPYRNRIITDGFISWKDLPQAIADVDINIAPLKESVFNAAKSENKWVEAALVKVPTVASDLGAFKRMIDPDVTGVLCENTTEAWKSALLDLIDHPEKRQRIGNAANDFCRARCTTIRSGRPLARYLESRQTPNVFFCLPSLDTSGGVLVILKHCCILQDNGYDVTIIDDSRRVEEGLMIFEDHVFPVLHAYTGRNMDRKSALAGRIDCGVATYFTTLQMFKETPNVDRILYCVQNFELDFYEPTHALRTRANSTYNDRDAEFITISKWCKGWLENDYGQTVRFAPNGLDCELFHPVERNFGSGKVRVLVEGDCDSPFKNVDEAALIANRLDPDRFEVWYLSYKGKPKDWYRVDRFLHDVPHEDMADIYRQCHILLKTSLLESFSYPPLEMMATGGLVAAIPNEGNREYLIDGENCLLFEHGDVDAGIEAIERLAHDDALRRRLYESGLETARSRDWKNLENDILALYE